ncbi:hypothetical protein G6011_05426 [Alternaria panax]|uniref:DNA-binding protein RAP1 n=1 Tax=Alternaria panax TaxID=48097 RepID=A0AAD4FCL9_9PLEO|nr:hypothetical protein G6011_05426 [Alternaria panax]
MAGPTVHKDVAEGFEFSSGAGIFSGKKFWVAQRVPSRTRLLDDIKANGGEMVVLEKKADYRIADHFRPSTCAPGTISYTFVEKSIKEGELQDPGEHAAGPPMDEAREPGSVHQPPKSGRAFYTAEEDRILYKWVRDAEAAGARVNGNEIYKQLEAKYPRHTWQSWRDRYQKQLKNRPPSTVNIPDNAPPSPPSDQSNERMPLALSEPAKQETPKTEQASNVTNLGSKGKSKTKTDYSVDELETMFSTDDWLHLYAFVEEINNLKGTDQWESAWDGWAEAEGRQTVDQWQQFYEKVVHLQWLRDPISQREKIKRKVVQKLDAPGSQPTDLQSPKLGKPDEIPSTAAAQEEVGARQPPCFDEKRFIKLLKEIHGERLAPAYALYAMEKKEEVLNAQPALGHVALHKLLSDQWLSLPAEEKAPYFAKDQSIMKVTLESSRSPAHIASETKVLSSSTAHPESLNFYKDQEERYTKRLRENDFVEQEEETQLAPPAKRQKSGSATFTQKDPKGSSEGVCTQNQPAEISSVENSQSTSESQDAEELMQEQIRSESPDPGDDDATMVNLDENPEEKEVESTESDSFLGIDQLHPQPPSDNVDLRSNTPTPRAARQKVSNFSTQAILSSTQVNVPRPHEHAYGAKPQEQRCSSPFQQPESDASTTQSVEEFRRCLAEEEDPDQTLYSQAPQQLLRLSPSPAPSSTSSISTDSGDPDPPLTRDEIDEFYEDRNEEGFPNEFISKALKRTRMRPELAVRVLEAWRGGKPLPMDRGIWSIEDDAAVESGDGLELAKLELKHSLDGWGGITERLKFLEAYRSYN